MIYNKVVPIRPYSPPHRLATITDGSRAGFRVPPPPAVDLRVGELFPGGRWKHRTSSPSTTSTLMVEIAATTKTSMAVPERRCMRRWSSGLRVVKWAKKRCTTKPPIHAQWKEGDSVEEGAVVGARRPHQEFDPYQAAVDQIADEDTETENGTMEAAAVDCRRRHGLASRHSAAQLGRRRRRSCARACPQWVVWQLRPAAPGSLNRW